MQVYAHSATSPPLQRALKSSLPYSVNLVHRSRHPNRTCHAHILATFPESTSPEAVLPECWAAAYLDRSMRPETELWIFSTLELPHHQSSATSSAGGNEGEKYCRGCRRAVLAVVDYMSTLPTPPLRIDNLPAMDLARQHEREYPTPPPSGAYESAPGTYMRHLLLPKAITVGACQRDVVRILHEAGVVRTELPGPDAELSKFLFKHSDLPETRELPAGLRWGEMREQDIETVQARTSIPRTHSTLISLKSVGVFEEKTDMPVAWTFLGLDGSLVALHTEEAYRGKGIAKAVATRLFKKHAQGLSVGDNGDSWSHADVYTGNIQSESVCRSLGGKALWKCFWLRIDLERAGNLVSIA